MSKYKDKSLRGKFAPMNMPRTHANCKEVYGVCRPGKTKVDKMRRALADSVSFHF